MVRNNETLKVLPQKCVKKHDKLGRQNDVHPAAMKTEIRTERSKQRFHEIQVPATKNVFSPTPTTRYLNFANIRLRFASSGLGYLAIFAPLI